MNEKSDILNAVCRLLDADRRSEAATLLEREYPFVQEPAVERKYGEVEALRIFMRDGFRDRYSGARLVFPGALRLLSELLPDEFPFHPNWKMSETHIAYWELSPTIDHIFPVSRGGIDAEENWVTTSMLRNSAKGNWTLQELGWTLLPPGEFTEWDGLMGWFRSRIVHRPALLSIPLVRRWNRAVVKLLPS